MITVTTEQASAAIDVAFVFNTVAEVEERQGDQAWRNGDYRAALRLYTAAAVHRKAAKGGAS